MTNKPKDATVGPPSTEPQRDAPPETSKHDDHVVSVGDKRALESGGTEKHRLTKLQREGREPEDSAGPTKSADE